METKEIDIKAELVSYLEADKATVRARHYIKSNFKFFEELKNKGYSLQRICTFMNDKGLKIEPSNFRTYYYRQLRKSQSALPCPDFPPEKPVTAISFLQPQTAQIQNQNLPPAAPIRSILEAVHPKLIDEAPVPGIEIFDYVKAGYVPDGEHFNPKEFGKYIKGFDDADKKNDLRFQRFFKIGDKVYDQFAIPVHDDKAMAAEFQPLTTAHGYGPNSEHAHREIWSDEVDVVNRIRAKHFRSIERQRRLCEV